MTKPPCTDLCGHDLHRWHFTCIFTCRHRRYHYHKIGEPQFYVDQRTLKVLPRYAKSYVLVVDRLRSYARVKDVLLKWILTIAEMLAN